VKISIDETRCMGHGRCYTLAPALVEADDIGNGRVTGDGIVAAGQVNEARRAAANCPERAVRFDEENDEPSGEEPKGTR
jgi:ferredoxin